MIYRRSLARSSTTIILALPAGLVAPAWLALLATTAHAQTAPPAPPAPTAPAAPAPGVTPALAPAGSPAPAAPNHPDAAASSRGSSLGLRDTIDWGLRLAYTNPSGNAWGGMPIDQMTEGVVFGQVDVNYILGDHLRGGVYGALGLGSNGDSVSSDCDSDGASCTVFLVDIGVQGEFRPLVDGAVEPWVGASLGADVLSRNVDYGALSVSYNIWGPAVSAAAGVDFDLGAITLGPYLSYKLGWYTWVDITDSSRSSADGDIDDVAAHRWFTIGMRGRHNFGG